MSLLRLPRASHTVALASLVAFATQVAFALLMLRLFTPEEVGEFSVLSQMCGTPRNSRRFCIASAATVQLPAESVVLISTSSL